MTLYHNGTILTMTRQTWDALVEEDGVIVALGSYDQLYQPQMRQVDLGGHALLPAFLDSHSHLTALALSLRLCPLGAVHTIPQLRDALVDYATHHPTGWIVGFGYDQSTFPQGHHPTRWDLDAAFPARPVLLTHASGHMGVVNSAAIALFGITDHTPDPTGGRLGRTSDGMFNGYLEETAFHHYAAQIPPETFGNPLENLSLAQETYFAQGITLAQEGLVGQREYTLLSQFAQSGKLALDVVGYVDMANDRSLTQSPQWGRSINHLSLGGYKLFLDGSPQGETAWMTAPYLGREDGHQGYPIHSDAVLTEHLKAALSQGVQVLVHCNGDAAADQLLRCCRQAQEAVGAPISSIRPVMIHAQLVRPDQLKEMATLGVLPSYFVSHTWYWGDIHRRLFGEKANFISPLAETQALGLPFTLHTDTPVLAPNLLEAVWHATHRLTRSGHLLGADQRISTLDALKAITCHAAYQYGLSHERGTLEVGKVADFVILAENPLTCADLRENTVLQTIKAGQICYTNQKGW